MPGGATLTGPGENRVPDIFHLFTNVACVKRQAGQAQCRPA